MKWLLIVLIFDGSWSFAPQQMPAAFNTEAECEFWAETIERGWQRVENIRYAVTCAKVLASPLHTE